MYTYDTVDRKTYMTLGVVLGALAGVGLGMLVAPRSGQETRAQMREKAMNAKQKAGEQFARKREKAMSAMGRSADRAKEVTDQASGQIQEATDQSQSGASSGRARRINGG